MKNSRAALKAVAAAVLAFTASLAAAGDTQNLNVSAVVQGICKFFTSAQTLSFVIDPSANAAITGSISSPISYKCTRGITTGAVAINSGLNPAGSGRQMRIGSTADVIAYTLSVAGGGVTGTGFGTGSTASPLTFTSSIAPVDFQNAAAGTYTDTIVITLTP